MTGGLAVRLSPGRCRRGSVDDHTLPGHACAEAPTGQNETKEAWKTPMDTWPSTLLGRGRDMGGLWEVRVQERG